MKKLLLILAIGAFVACNDNAGTDDATTDTVPTTPAPVDTAVTPMDTTVTRPADTTVQK